MDPTRQVIRRGRVLVEPMPDHAATRPATGDLHVVLDGPPGAPAMVLIHGSAGCTAWWDPVIPRLADAFRIIRVDLAGHGRSAGPQGGYDIPTHASRVAAVLDRLGADRVTVVGHSMGCLVATALAEQRREAVAGLALVDMGPSLDAATPEGLLVRVLLSRFPGPLLWRLRSEATIRAALSSAVTRRVAIPAAAIEGALGMTHRALAGTSRGATAYLRQHSLPTRLAGLDLPLLVIFGAADQRYPSSSAAAYRAVRGARVDVLPGVGHTPMIEDPARTSALLLDFAASV